MKHIALAAMLAVAMTTAAHSQGAQCGPVMKLIEGLAKKYGEHPAVTFESPRGHVVGFYNQAQQSWTLVTVQGGMACIRATGTGPLKFHKGKKGSKIIPGLPA